MGSVFTAEFFTNNRKKLRTLFTGTAPIVLTASGLLQRNADSTFPFRQDSNFWYLTGIKEPDVILVLDKEKEYLILPERDENRQAFDGTIQTDDLTEISGITTILDEKSGWKQLSGRIGRVKHVATLGAMPIFVADHGMYTNPARQRLIKRLKQDNSDLELLDLRPHLTKMRSIKQPEELVAIQAAIDITIDAFKKAQRKIPKSSNERDIEALMDYEFRMAGAVHAYQPIVAAGKNACTLHYVANNSALKPNEMVLLDIGAEVENYAADLSRTYPIGKLSRRQEKVLDAVLEVHDFACAQLKPGISIREAEQNIVEYMGEKLRVLGLIKSIDNESVRKYYPHATSHYLGLDVHDTGDYDAPLEAGMVLTVEPGIYIHEESIGIRIEDNLLITAEGATMLTDRLPRDPR